MNGSEEKRQDAINIPPQAATSEAGRPPSAPPTLDPRLWQPKGYYSEDPRRKSPALATLLSLVPGLGQVYVGYYEQGFINILVIAALITLLQFQVHELRPLFALFMVFFWLYNLIDAARRAAFYNHALAGLGPMELPERMQIPTGKGSLFGGALLIVVGALTFAHTRFGYSMRWVADWWPVVLILIGAYLLVKALLDRRKEARGL